MDEAIEAYSKAIALEENHIFYSNRSAAYLTKGDAEKALADAITCLELNPDFVKGYSRNLSDPFSGIKLTIRSCYFACQPGDD